MALTTVQDSASISTTEYSLPADTTTGVPTSQTDDCMLQVSLRIASMAAGDRFRVRVYETINAGQVVVFDATIAAAVPSLVTPALVVSQGWDVTVIKEAGTDRTVHWKLEKLGV